MKKFSSFARIAPILVAAVLFTAQNAMAANLTFSFGATDGALGHTATSTNGGYTLNAAAFTTGSSNLFLYNKVTAGDPTETGLGICGASSPTCSQANHEINNTSFVQLNFTSVVGLTGFVISISSDQAVGAQANEHWAIYKTNTAGALGTLLYSDTTAGVGSQTLTASDLANYKYFNITAWGTATNPDVLINGMTATTATPTPEPASLALFGSGLLGLAGLKRRKAAR